MMHSPPAGQSALLSQKMGMAQLFFFTMSGSYDHLNSHFPSARHLPVYISTPPLPVSHQTVVGQSASTLHATQTSLFLLLQPKYGSQLSYVHGFPSLHSSSVQAGTMQV